MRKLFKFLLKLISIVIVLALVFVAFLSIKEYKPAPIESVPVEQSSPTEKILKTDESISILSWNIGYSGLGKDSDFFMDGGKDTRSADETTVRAYLDGIYETMFKNEPASIYLLQEVDIDSHRSFRIDQKEALGIMGNTNFALNYSCPFVPFPMPPIGKVEAGLMTTTDYMIESAERHSLPCPFTWPVSTANLKRCLLVSYMPVEGSDKQLVLINLHVEAYDSGEGKIAQTKQIVDFISSEYAKGNYVIAGGDFNQVFPDTTEKYPILHPELWSPGLIGNDMLPEGWTLAFDASVPTCRLLNQPYDVTDTENTQHYVIDGFILSPNVSLETVKTLDLGFENSDHNPVRLEFILNK